MGAERVGLEQDDRLELVAERGRDLGRAELSAQDGRRLGIAPGDQIEVAVNGTSVRARAALREALPAGSVFLVEGTSQDNANALTNGGGPVTVEVRKP